MTGSTGKWTGVNDGEPWAIEIEPDCMAATEPFTVSILVGPTAGAYVTAGQAREIAQTLQAAADNVDANNRRIDQAGVDA